MKISWTNHRLKKTWEFQRIIKERKKIFNEQFIIYYSNHKNLTKKNERIIHCRFGITIPQKIIKKAFLRNKYKRQIRSIILNIGKNYDGYLEKLSRWDFVIVIRNEFTKNDFEKNENKLKKILDFFVWKNRN